MRDSLRRAICIGTTSVLAVFGSSCGFDEGPSLDVQIENVSLQPTAGHPTVCCCRVAGDVLNRSSIPVHVSVAYQAFQAGDPKPVSRAVDWVENLQPSERRAFTAVGFVLPCGSIEKYTLVEPLNVRAVWLPR